MSRILPLLLLLLVSACAGDRPSVHTPWVHTLRAEHPLVGRIWDPKAAVFIEESEAVARAGAADHVLLGERHDNADHHRLQARVAQAVLAGDRGRVIAMEMLTPDQEPAAQAFMAARPMDAAGFGDAVGWSQTGWPDWAIYRPIGEIALVYGAPVRAANLTRAEAQALRRGGAAGLAAERRTALGLDRELPPELKPAMEREIADSHCGALPQSALAPFASIQWARDAAMAHTMLAAGRSILIAGAGHVRTDRGVPLHLRERAPGARILSIAFVEVSAELTDPRAREWPFDLVWFTPRVDEVDPCVRFRERMRPAGRSGASGPT